MAGNLTNMIASIFSGSAVTADPYYEYTTLLLPGSGTNGAQNNTFLDGSTNNFTITRNGNTTQGTFSPFSQTGWGNYFDGTGDYLLTTSTQIIPSGSFTVEAWVYPTASTDAYAVAQGTTGNAGRFSLGITSNLWYVQIGSAQVNAGSITLNQWTYLAATFNGTTLTLYVNGSSVGTAGTTTNAQNTTLRIGSLGPADWGTSYWTGYISNVRTSNTVRTVTTVPTTSFTNDGNTTFLSCQSNRFIDNSTNNFTITRNGDTRVVAFSPFNPTASWSAATYGGSGYFDGSGDYLTVPGSSAFNFGTNNFTIEEWFYIDTDKSIASGGMVFDYNYEDIQLYYVNSPTKIYCDIRNWGTNVSLASTSNIVQGQWYHVAIVRDGLSSVKMYLNGVLEDTELTNPGSINLNTYPLVYGARLGPRNSPSSPDYLHKGYISGARILNGTAINFASTGIPTSPPTNITNTSLLLNFTNGGIYDATSKNDLETVGNAQIVAPTPTKWGGGSMAFDGTTDYLVEPTSVYFGYGTGDFTIEFWVYFNSTGTSTIFSNLSGTASTNPHIYINSTIRFYNGGGDRITSSTSPSTGVWYHLAVCRASGSTRMFLDGTQTGSTYADTNDYGQSAPLGVGTYWNGGAPVTASTLNGYLQDVRVSKYARYVTGTGANAGKMVFNGTNNLALPTAAFPTL
jgi:hypothetical protein